MSFDFRSWRLRRGITQKQAGQLLELSTETIKCYERGFRKGSRSDVPVHIPRVVVLACSALDMCFDIKAILREDV